MNRVDELLNKIEAYRKEMIELGLSTSLTNEQVLRISTELDKILNSYFQIEEKKIEKL